MSKLKESLHAHIDDFYDYLIENSVADETYEFGAWDHFWLSALISHWVKRFSDIPNSGVNNEFITCCLEDGEKLQKLTFEELSDRFLRMSAEDADEQFFEESMEMLKKFYRLMWT
jgi:hypothetical protein